MKDDIAYMAMALGLAGKARSRTFPNPLVGAVLVSKGEVVSEGFHSMAGDPHAEIVAIRNAGESARGATLYLNLEPCSHHGKTPPCADAIIEAGISKVVFSIYDPDERVSGSGAARLRDNGVEVETGLMAEEAVELNLPYLHKKMTGRPFIVLKLALSLDGRLTVPGKGWFTSEASRKEVHRIRASLECIAVGRGTLEADDPELDRRFIDPALPPPVRMVFDSSLSFPPDHRWLGRGDKVIIYCKDKAEEKAAEALEKAGAEVVALRGRGDRVDLEEWVRDVSARGFSSVLVEGGASVADSMVRAGLFDRLVLFHAPLFSGAGGISWLGDERLQGQPGRGGLVLYRSEKFEDDIMAVYDRSEVASYRERLLSGGV